LKINNPTSIVIFPESNEFLVHYESALFSYPLDLIVRVSRGDSTPESLDESKEKLAEGHGDILFFKAGCVSDRTSSKESSYLEPPFCFFYQQTVVYAAKNSEQVTSHVLELTPHWQNGNREALADRAPYRPLGSVRVLKRSAFSLNVFPWKPMPISEDPHDATFFLNKVAISASRAIYVVEPMK